MRDGVALENEDDGHGRRCAEELDDHVSRHFGVCTLAPQPDGERDRRIVMATGDVAAGIDHDHQDRADARGAMSKSDLAPITVWPIVRTRKNVPINSTISFLNIVQTPGEPGERAWRKGRVLAEKPRDAPGEPGSRRLVLSLETRRPQ